MLLRSSEIRNKTFGRFASAEETSDATPRTTKNRKSDRCAMADLELGFLQPFSPAFVQLFASCSASNSKFSLITAHSRILVRLPKPRQTLQDSPLHQLP